MKKKINKIRNPRFDEGKKEPRGWSWKSLKGGHWSRQESSQASGGVVIETAQMKGRSSFSQVVVCKPDTDYRIEATVTCDLTSLSQDGSTGVFVEIHPLQNDNLTQPGQRTQGLLRASEPIAIRTYYETSPNTRRLHIAVVVEGAKGTVEIQEVRLIEIIEPDLLSHPMAIPPPVYTVPIPKVAKRLCVCSVTAHVRPLTSILASYYGSSKVTAVDPAKFKSGTTGQDAVFFPDDKLPTSLRSLNALIKLAQDRIVIVSLPALATLVGSALSLRRITQNDDPIHAKIAYANHVTRGFALDDIFPYAWSDQKSGYVVQNQFRKTPAQEAFCKKNQFATLLHSMCDQDVTSDRPICFYKESERGGLYVLDIEPVEETGSTYGEPTLAMHLLLNILGQTQNALGQFTAPVATESLLRDSFRDTAGRLAAFHVHDSGLPIEEVTEQLITIGSDDASFGLPLAPKPVILIRTGLIGGDAESVYGAFLWFKQLIRPVPYQCPYADALATQFRLAWIPCAAPWQWGDGWQRDPQLTAHPCAIDFDDAEVAAIIDIVSQPSQKTRVVMPKRQGPYERIVNWLPRLAASFPAGNYYARVNEPDEPFTNRDACDWRHYQSPLEMVVDGDAFTEDAHQQVLDRGGMVLRLEVPGSSSDFVCQSIIRTDLTATLLEHVVGLVYGLIAVNRKTTSTRFNGFPPIKPGLAIILDSSESLLNADASQVG